MVGFCKDLFWKWNWKCRWAFKQVCFVVVFDFQGILLLTTFRSGKPRWGSWTESRSCPDISCQIWFDSHWYIGKNFKLVMRVRNFKLHLYAFLASSVNLFSMRVQIRVWCLATCVDTTIYPPRKWERSQFAGRRQRNSLHRPIDLWRPVGDLMRRLFVFSYACSIRCDGCAASNWTRIWKNKRAKKSDPAEAWCA